LISIKSILDPEERRKDVIHEFLDRPIFSGDAQPSTSKDPSANLRKKIQDKTVPKSFNRPASNSGPSVKRQRTGLGIVLKSLDKGQEKSGSNG